jgi:hypothetical protein
MRTAIAEGLKPMQQMGPTIGQEFNQVGGTIMTMFRRIDASMKFPKFDAAITDLKDKLRRFGTGWFEAGNTAKKAGDESRQAWSQTPQIVAELIAGTDQLAARQSKLYHPVAELAKAWDSIKARVAAANAELALASSRPPPAGRRPGVGRTLSLPKPDIDPWTRALARIFDGAGLAAKGIGAIAPSFSFATKVATSFGTAVSLAVAAPLRVFSYLGSGITSIGQGIFRWKNFTSSLGDVAGKTYSDLVKQHGLVKASLGAPTMAVKALANTILKIGTLGAFGRAKKDADAFRGSMSKSVGSVNQLSGAVKGFGRDLAVAFGLFGAAYKIAEFFKMGIKGAIDLNETVNVTNETFGKQSQAVQDFAGGLSKSYGFSRRELLETANTFGALTQGVKITEEESAKLSQTYTKLAADAVSYKNVDLKTAADKLTSGLSGEAQGLKEWGILINEDMVKARALSMGLSKGKGELSEYAKMMARASLISQGLNKASGDLERTSGSTANQFRKAGGGIENFSVMIGQMLLPAVDMGVQAFNEFLAVTIEAFENSRPIIEQWASYLTSAMDAVGSVVRNFGLYWQVVTLRVGEFASNTVAYLQFLPENVGRITEWIFNNWQTMLGDLIILVGTFGKNLVNYFLDLGKAVWEAFKGGTFKFEFSQDLLKGFHAETEKFPEMLHAELIDVSKEIDAVYDEIGRKEAARSKALAKAVPAAGKLNDKTAVKATDKLAGLAELGSKEAYSAISKAQGGGRAKGMESLDKTAKTHLDESRKQTALLQKVAAQSGPTAPVFSF